MSERRRAEEALRRSEEHYRLLAENTTDIIMQFGLDTNLIYISPSVKSALGIDPEGLTTAKLLERTHPDDRPIEANSRREFAQTGISTVITRSRHADGRYIWFETASRLVNHPQTGEPLFIISSTRDISARKAVEEQLLEHKAELQNANFELAQASRLKDEFLANVSHELRTPLTGVLGLTEALQAGVYGPVDDRKVRILRMVEEAGRHLLNLINDILDLSKIEAGQMTLDLQEITVSDLCEACIRMVHQIALQKRQKLDYQIEPAQLVAQADIRRLKQILVNLLGNAVKFTPEGGELGLRVHPDETKECIEFIVWDHGIGIAPDKQATIFHPFVQIDGGLARQYAGTGLGLALARKLTELHNGTISITSEVGVGSEFRVAIPWVKATARGQG
ncbi:MAG: PAS domain-containing sensor histidine kinase [Anaerolineales bacterium]|nr:PAS domain-containing sensor histidine kinase [Anaerolineales bacterium]